MGTRSIGHDAHDHQALDRRIFGEIRDRSVVRESMSAIKRYRVFILVSNSERQTTSVLPLRPRNHAHRIKSFFIRTIGRLQTLVPIHRLIDLQARNEEMRARGYSDGDLVPLDWWQKTFGYIATFGMQRLEA